MAKTAMQAAFKAAGGPAPAWARFEVELAKVLNAGYTTDHIRLRLDEIDEQSGRGQASDVRKGHQAHAASRLPNEDGAGQAVGAGDGHVECVRPSPTERDAKGQHSPPEKVRPRLPDASHPSRDGGHASSASRHGQVAPAREPNKPRGLEAIELVQPTIAKSLFDTERLPDGRKLGDVKWGELRELSRRYARWSRVFALLEEHAQADPDTIVRDAVSEDWLKQAIRIAELRNAE